MVDDTVVFPRRQLRGMSWRAGSLSAGAERKFSVSGNRTWHWIFKGLLRSALDRSSQPGRQILRAGGCTGRSALVLRPGGANDLPGSRSPCGQALSDAGRVSSRLERVRLAAMDYSAGGAKNSRCRRARRRKAGISGGLPENFILLHPSARGVRASRSTPRKSTAFCERNYRTTAGGAGRQTRERRDFKVPATAVDLIGPHVADRTHLGDAPRGQRGQRGQWPIAPGSRAGSPARGDSHLERPEAGWDLIAQDAWVWKNGRLLTMAQIATQPDDIFSPSAGTALTAADVGAICDRAISLSNFCA